jgi:hypothetical protein
MPTLRSRARRETLFEELGEGFNVSAHSFAHDPAPLIYTSATTLDTVAGTPIHLPYDFQIIGVSANVAGAPSGAALIWDVLVDGVSAFTAAADRISIAAGDVYSLSAVPDLDHLTARMKLQCQGVTISSATGPIVVIFELARL